MKLNDYLKKFTNDGFVKIENAIDKKLIKLELMFIIILMIQKNFYKKFDFIWMEGTIHHSENISSAVQNLSIKIGKILGSKKVKIDKEIKV